MEMKLGAGAKILSKEHLLGDELELRAGTRS